MEKDIQQLEGIASQIIKTEAQELLNVADRIDQAVVSAAKIILKHDGKIVVSGVGKSGLIGQKIVATLCSTGTQAVFLHASDALHGDLGVYRPGDPTILISKSGATDEIVRLIPLLREFKSPLIGIVGNIRSSLAEKVDVVLDSTVSSEADPLGVVPTNSTTVTMAIGDALASVLMTAKKFNQDDFARFHPGGNLGKRLKLLVSRQKRNSFVLAADTAVCLGERILGKPGNEEEAVEMLLALSGHRHIVRSGYCFVNEEEGIEVLESVSTEVYFSDFDESVARGYVATGESLDKAGAYGIQGNGSFLVKKIVGSYTNVVGLPMAEVVASMVQLGIISPAVLITQD